MNKRFFSLRTVGLLSIATLVGFLSTGGQVSAASNYDLISNAVYLNKNSMTRAQIQKFLEDRGSKLATYKDQGPNETKKELASYLIWHAAQIWGINPQVILATLQKEQSLITNPNPSSIALRSAMGYGCPDSAACNTKYYGFANQVNMATYQFRYNYEALKGNSSFVDIDGDVHGVGYYACDSATHFYNRALRPGNTVTFKRNTAFSSTKDKTVKIANEATASLLCYTPHVGPYSETGYSGSDNFVYWFKQWFGSTHYTTKGAIGIKYRSLGGATSKLGGLQSNEIKISGGVYQRFEKGRIYWSSKTGAWSVRGGIQSKYLSLGAEKSFLGYPLSDEISVTGGVYQKFQGGYIFWSSTTDAQSTHGAVHKKYLDLDTTQSPLGFPTSGEKRVSGGVYQQFEKGRIYWSSKTGAWSVTEDMINHYTDRDASTGYLGFPLRDQWHHSGHKYQRFQGGTIYIRNNGDVWIVRGGIGSLFSRLGYHTSNLGFPTANESRVTGGAQQNFDNGKIYWSSKTGAQEVYGHLAEYHTSRSGVDGRLGYPLQSQRSGGGYIFQQFQGGTVYAKSGLGTFIVLGGIQRKYVSVGEHRSFLRYPVSDEIPTTGGVYQKFQGGYVFWSSKTGAQSTHGAIHAKYLELGAEKSFLGFPASGEVKIPGGAYQQFEKGRIYWSSKTGAWSVRGGIQAKYLGIGGSNSRLGFPKSGELPDSINGGVYQKFTGGTIHWKPGWSPVYYY